jgi:hypothetical protein
LNCVVLVLLYLNGCDDVYADDSFIRKGSHLEQRQKLGLVDHPPRSNGREFHSEPTSALEKVEVLQKELWIVQLPLMVKSGYGGLPGFVLKILWLFSVGGEGQAG